MATRRWTAGGATADDPADGARPLDQRDRFVGAAAQLELPADDLRHFNRARSITANWVAFCEKCRFKALLESRFGVAVVRGTDVDIALHLNGAHQRNTRSGWTPLLESSR
jgi:hypothetical protein